MMAVSGQTLWRYPGPQPFSESDLHRRLFFGREEESHALLHLILANQLVILYGNSGLGKTSLLRAGVFHQLRENGYLPLVIRVNDTTTPPLQALIAAIEEACKRQAIEFTKGEQTSLWEFFKTSIFWHGSETQTPVLILDQFEEFFSLHSASNRDTLARELGQLLGTGLPEAVRKRREAGEKITYIDRPPLVKLLLVFREEYLGALEELSPQLPTIMETRFRLVPMNREAAKRAILKPALLPQDNEILTPSFEYSDAALNELLDFLGGKVGEVDPYTLQLLCRHVEEKVVPRVSSPPTRMIQSTDLGGQSGLHEVIRTFYRQAIGKLRGWRQRKRARKLCAAGLVSPSQHRLSIHEFQIKKTYKVRSETLNRLVDARILRKELRNGTNYYELSHDRLVQPVLKYRPLQLPPGLKNAIWKVFLAFILLFGVGILVGLAVQLKEERDHAQSVLDFMIFELRDKLSAKGERELLEVVSNKVLEEYKHLHNGEPVLEDPAPAILNALGAAFEIRGDMRVGKRASAEALENYHRAIDMVNKAKTHAPDERVFQENLANVYRKMANIHKDRSDLEKALNALESENTIWNGLVETFTKDEDKTKVVRRLVGNLGALGDAQMSLGNLRQAQKYFEDEKQSIQENLIKQEPDNDDWQHSMALAHMHIGDVFFAQGYQDKAMEEFQTARGILSELVKREERRGDWRYSLAATDGRIGSIDLDRFQLTEVRRMYESKLSIAQDLVKDAPRDQHYRRMLWMSYNETGGVHMAGYEAESSLWSHEAAWKLLSRRKSAIDRSFSGPILNHSSISHNNAFQAEASYKNALDIATSFEKHDSENIQSQQTQRDVARSHVGLGKAAVAQGQFNRGLDEFKTAGTISTRLLEMNQEDIDTQALLVDINVLKSHLLIRGDQFDEALTAIESARMIVAKRLDKEPSKDWQERLSNSYDCLGDIAVARGDLTEAHQAYTTALEEREKLMLFDPSSSKSRLSIAVAHYKLASLDRMSGSAQDPAGSHLKRSLNILRELQAMKRLPPIALNWSAYFESRM